MARSGSPLYDAILSKSGTANGVQVPGWADRTQSTRSRVKAQQPPTETGRSPSPMPEPANIRTWMQTPIAFRLPRAGAGILALFAVGLIVGVYYGGYYQGQNQARAQASSDRMQELRSQPINRQLIPAFVPRTQRPTVPVADRRQPPTAAVNTAGQRRIDGLNYFRLMEVPDRWKSEGERAVAFLREQGVDAKLIPLQNGQSFKVIALRGFEKPLSDPQAAAYKQVLLDLGRRWKQSHNGQTDWSDLYPEKFRAE